MMGNLAIPLVEHAGFIQLSCLEAPGRLGGYLHQAYRLTSYIQWTMDHQLTKLINHTYP
jgi:hypothetical protein